MYLLNYKIMTHDHIHDALNLVLEAYEEEKSIFKYLPNQEDHRDIIVKYLEYLIEKGMGMVAFHEGELVGFILGYKLNSLWGHDQGFYSPLLGHGGIKNHRKKIYQGLYTQISRQLVKEKITSHAITLYPQDETLLETFFWLGFGNRCVDAMAKVETQINKDHGFIIKKIGLDQIDDLRELQDRLHVYFEEAPLFMPVDEEDPIAYFRDWLSKDNRHVWLAYKDEKPVAFMKIQSEGENYITSHPSVMNITGAYVLEAFRGQGLSGLLIHEIQAWLLDKHYKILSVDYESFNLNGASLWQKYFTPYTYTLTRRIDERILE